MKTWDPTKEGCPKCGHLGEWESDGSGGRFVCWICFATEYLRVRQERWIKKETSEESPRVGIKEGAGTDG